MDALNAAQDALSFFRAAGDFASTADAVAVIIQCYIHQGRLEEAGSLAKDEIAAFRKAGKKSEEAKMVISHADVLSRDPKQFDEAPSHGKLGKFNPLERVPSTQTTKTSQLNMRHTYDRHMYSI